MENNSRKYKEQISRVFPFKIWDWDESSKFVLFYWLRSMLFGLFILYFIQMSVIGLNLWIAIELLKTNLSETKSKCQSEMQKYNRDTMQNVRVLVDVFMEEITRRDQIIEKLLKQQNKCEGFHKEGLKVVQMDNHSYREPKQAQIFQFERKLNEKDQLVKELECKNKEYEKEIEMILEEMKTIKNYLEELKKIKSSKVSFQKSYENSPVKELEDQENEILTKMSSLTNLDRMRVEKLDTIKEVTEMSLHSEEGEAELFFSSSDTFDENMSPQTFQNQYIPHEVVDSSSFECVSEVRDINRFFCSKSKDLERNSIQNESYQESLSILKNYVNPQQTAHTEGELKAEIKDCSSVVIPELKFKKKINERHIQYENGFTYTGNVAIIKDCPRPMGFGQLFKDGQLFYCGNWKNGVFDGWGKIYLPKNGKIKQFNGQLSHGKPHGPGSLKFWNGQKFMGTFHRGKVEGEGSLISQEGKRKAGFWRNNILLSEKQN